MGDLDSIEVISPNYIDIFQIDEIIIQKDAFSSKNGLFWRIKSIEIWEEINFTTDLQQITEVYTFSGGVNQNCTVQIASDRAVCSFCVVFCCSHVFLGIRIGL